MINYHKEIIEERIAVIDNAEASSAMSDRALYARMVLKSILSEAERREKEEHKEEDSTREAGGICPVCKNTEWDGHDRGCSERMTPISKFADPKE